MLDICKMVRIEERQGRKYVLMTIGGGERVLDYQIEMINNNEGSGLLPLGKSQFNNQVDLYGDITNLISINEYFKSESRTSTCFVAMIKNIVSLILSSQDYLLNKNNYIVNIDYIFLDTRDLSVKMLYVPVENDLREDIMTEMRLLIKNLIIEYGLKKDTSLVELLNFITIKDSNIIKLDEFLNNMTIDENREKASEDLNTEDVKPKKKGKIYYPGNLTIIVSQLIVLVVIIVLFAALSNKTLVINITGAILFLDLIFGLMVMFKKINLQGISKKNSKIPSSKEPEDLTNNSNSSKQAKAEESLCETDILEETLNYLTFTQDGIVERIDITKDEFIFGRLRGEVDYTFKSPTVGKIHAKIKNIEGKCFLIDLQSRNGTYINGIKLISNQPYELKDNDEVGFANLKFIFKAQE